jgi:hypothetical protein
MVCVRTALVKAPASRSHRAGDRVRRRPKGAIENLGGAAEEVGSAVTIAYATITE